MHNMNRCKAQSKERVRESQWIKRKQQDMFRGSSTQLYIPAFDTRRISNPLACPQRTPTKGTSTEDLGQSQLQGVPNSSPYKHNLLLEAQLQANQQSPHNLRDFHKPMQRSPHNLEGYNPIANLPQHNEGKAQSQAKDRVYNLVVSNNNHKTISFSHTKSYRKDSRF